VIKGAGGGVTASSGASTTGTKRVLPPSQKFKLNFKFQVHSRCDSPALGIRCTLPV
jgi:hypothetical protein